MTNFNKKDYEAVTIITITQNRVKYLERAIQTVKEQDYQGKIHHFIYIDDCPKTLEFLKNNYEDDPNVSWYYYKRKDDDLSGPSLLARLRNDAITRTVDKWLCYLDDDNEFYPEHIRNLYEFAVKNHYSAVYCNVEMLRRDGSKFLEEYWPWAREENRISKYQYMLREGLVERGSNIRRYKYGIVVDTNVWLVKREVWEDCKIDDNFTQEDWENNLAEDDKLMYKMIEKGYKAYNNGATTVKYYLGGYSNEFNGSEDGTIVWKEVCKYE